MIEKIEHHPLVAGLLLAFAVISAVVGIMSQVVEGESKWAAFRRIMGRVLWYAGAPWTSMRAISKMDGKIDSIRAEATERDAQRKIEIEAIQLDIKAQRRDFEKIAKEVTSNGGESMKDVVTLLRADFKQRIAHRAYPYFMMDAEGRMTGVSRALGDLVGLEQPEHMMGFEWRRWLFNEEQSLFLENLNRAIADRSGFRLATCMVNARSERLGRWEWFADVAMPKPSSPLVFLGVVRPVDEMAKRVAAELEFQYPK